MITLKENILRTKFKAVYKDKLYNINVDDEEKAVTPFKDCAPDFPSYALYGLIPLEMNE